VRRRLVLHFRQDRVSGADVTVMSVVFVAAYNFQVLVPLLTFPYAGLGLMRTVGGVVMSFLGLGCRDRCC